jgi:hypothetical protein
MILYNVTVGVDLDTEIEWLEWMKSKHIPDVMATGYFEKFEMYKVLGEQQEETVSYSVQYFSDSIDKVVEYLNKRAPALSEEHRNKFKDRHVAFRTLLESVHK